MSPAPLPVHLLRWIDEHAHELEPPVSNKVVMADDDIIAMVVRGPNARSDFHVDPRDELFYQVSGDIRVDLIDERGERVHRVVHEGELLLVPGGMPHAPLRPPDTWGLVIERPRADGEVDQLLWLCDVCGEEVHRVAFALTDIEAELGAAIEAYNADESLRTCGNCGAVAPVPEPFRTDDLDPDRRP